VGNFYTYVKDLRPFGSGTPVSYNFANLASALFQGEFVAWDAAAKVLVRYVRTGSAGKLVGVSRDSQAGLQSLGNQAALSAAINPFSVWTTGVHEMLGTAGETYTHGIAVYMQGTDTTAITSSQGAGGVQVGSVHLPDGAVKTGAVRVPILIDNFTETQV